MMEEALKDVGDIVVVKFNPWYFRSEGQLIDGFFYSIADALRRSLRPLGKRLVRL